MLTPGLAGNDNALLADAVEVLENGAGRRLLPACGRRDLAAAGSSDDIRDKVLPPDASFAGRGRSRGAQSWRQAGNVRTNAFRKNLVPRLPVVRQRVPAGPLPGADRRVRRSRRARGHALDRPQRVPVRRPDPAAAPARPALRALLPARQRLHLAQPHHADQRREPADPRRDRGDPAATDQARPGLHHSTPVRALRRSVVKASRI